MAFGPQARQLPALTGLRGFGAIWVFLHHLNLFSFGTGRGIHVLAVGYLGVDLFFLLSGFVMSHAKYDNFLQFDAGEIARFAAERILRLFPANAAVMVGFLLVVLAVPALQDGHPAYVYSAFSFIISALLIQSWLPFPLGAWISPGWSVSAELGAYAALPLLLFAVRRVRRPAVAMALAFLSLAGFVALLLAVGVHDVDVTVRGGLVRLAFEFTAGALVYQAWRRGAVAPSWLCNVAALAILIAVLTPVPAATFVALPGFAIVLLASAQGTSWIGRVFATRAMLFAGRVSYSLYLVHWPVLVVWQHFAGPPAATPAWIASVVVVLLVTPALAIACHYMVEAPSHRWARVAVRDRATATALA